MCQHSAYQQQYQSYGSNQYQQQYQQQQSYGSQQYASTPAYSQQQYSAPQQSYAQSSYSGHQHQSSSYSSNGQSQVEQAVRNSQEPIQTNEREQTTAGQFSGIYLNKSEADQFRGPIPLEQYQINNDPNPEVIKKRLGKVRYTQEVAVRYLNPPPAPKPGDIVVREKTSSLPAAPPVVIRQEAGQAQQACPLVYRERPPCPPPCVPETVVEIERCQPPPPRRVVVEKLSNLPPKPQNILIEKWLPYKQQKRRVRYERNNPYGSNLRNTIIEWEGAEAEVCQVCQDLGTQDQCPDEYTRRYGNELKDSSEIPNLCPRPQCGCPGGNQLPELEGDIDALRQVDLEKYGLGEYRRYIQ